PAPFFLARARRIGPSTLHSPYPGVPDLSAQITWRQTLTPTNRNARHGPQRPLDALTSHGSNRAILTLPSNQVLSSFVVVVSRACVAVRSSDLDPGVPMPPRLLTCIVLAALVAQAPAQSEKRSSDGRPTPAPRLDQYGDPLPAGAVQRLGTARLVHG